MRRYWMYLVLMAILAAPHPATAGQWFVWVYDNSQSTTQYANRWLATFHHAFELARLSGEEAAFAVLVVGGQAGGGQDVRLLAGSDGLPTTAYETLYERLRTEVPPAGGATPLDEAFEALEQLDRRRPADTRLTMILVSDGTSNSGRLRPEAFTEVRAAMEAERQTTQQAVRGFEPHVIQDELARLERSWQTPGTDPFNRLYQVQLPLEHAKVLQHAKSLARTRVRWITLDFFGQSAPLAEIHAAAGGQAGDLLRIPQGAGLLAELHGLNLFTSDRLLALPLRTIEAAADARPVSIGVPLDPIGGAVQVALEFFLPIDEFEQHAQLVARIGGRKITFRSDDPQALLSADSTGKTVLATLTLSELPPADRAAPLTLEFTSPSGVQQFPGGKLYVHIRLRDDLAPVFRPARTAADAPPPYVVSPPEETVWEAEVSSTSDAQRVPLAGVEVELIELDSGRKQGLSLVPDLQSAGLFQGPLRLEAGTYDVMLHLKLLAGGTTELRLRQHVVSRRVDEIISLEIPQAGVNRTTTDQSPLGCLQFQEVGDETDAAQVDVLLRTTTPYPLTVTPRVTQLHDEAGQSLVEPWLTLDPPELTLEPGQAHRLRLKLKLPKQIDQRLTDGQFRGQLTLMRSGSSQPLVIRRFEPLAGIPDDLPIERITFMLRRPRLEVQALFARCDHVCADEEGHLTLPLNVRAATPHRRRVQFVVRHTSTKARRVTLSHSPEFFDADQKPSRTVRLLPVAGVPNDRLIGPDEVGIWDYELQVDRTPDADRAAGRIVISGDGCAALGLTTQLRVARPLLGPGVRGAALVLALLLGVATVRAVGRWRARRRFLPGQGWLLTPSQGLAGVLQIGKVGQHKVRLLFGAPGTITLPAAAALAVRPQSHRDVEDTVLRPAQPGLLRLEAGQQIELLKIERDPKQEPRLQTRIRWAGPWAEEARRARRTAWRCAAFAVALATLAALLPSVLFDITQTVLDWLLPS